MMKFTTRFILKALLCCSFLWLLPDQSAACGYSFIGNCSSEIRFLINGTEAKYNVAECFYGSQLHGAHMGPVRNLSIHYAFAATWESCINNVSAMHFKYRITRQGYGDSNWKSYTLQEDSMRTILPYTARYFSSHSDLSLTDGLTPGDYVFEMFIQADIDTIGDDYIPETVMLKNNEGLNYGFSFTYAGPSAPPFLAVPAVISSPTCSQGNNGVAGVVVYGDQSNLTYSWSHGGAPIAMRYDLTAGDYQLTISNGNGTSQVAAIKVPAPEPVEVSFPVVRPLGCGGDGMAFAKGSGGGGGTYYYTWSTGSLLPSTFVGSPGTVTVTVTDTRGCSKAASVAVPSGGTVRKNLSVSICSGESWVVEGVAYIQSGNYTYIVPGTVCDTTVYLTLQVVSPADDLLALPTAVPLTDCKTEYGASVCINATNGTSFIWKNGTAITGNQPCLKGLGGTQYSVTAFRKLDNRTCKSSRVVSFMEGGYAAAMQGLVEPDYCHTQAMITIQLIAQTEAPEPTYTWHYGGDIIGTTKVIDFTITDWQQQLPTLPTLVVRDTGGCVVTAENQVAVLLPPVYGIQFLVKNATVGQSDGAISAQITGGIPDYAYLWSTGATTAQLTMLKAGTYCLTVTDREGCTRTSCATVNAISGTTSPDISEKVRLFPNPTAPQQVLTVELPLTVDEEKMQFRILDAVGRSFFCPLISGDAGVWHIQLPASFSSGWYVLLGWSDQHFFKSRLEVMPDRL